MFPSDVSQLLTSLRPLLKLEYKGDLRLLLGAGCGFSQLGFLDPMLLLLQSAMVAVDGKATTDVSTALRDGFWSFLCRETENLHMTNSMSFSGLLALLQLIAW